MAELGKIAEALKHSAKIDRTGRLHVKPEKLRDDILAVPDYYAEPNILAPWIVEVDGNPISLAVTIGSAVNFWKTKLGP